MKTIENKYNCPKALWNKFTNKAKSAYNHFRGEVTDIDFILPTRTSKITPEDWDIVSHNIAALVALDYPSKKDDLMLWNYLKKKLKPLNDNNLTAREIFERVTQ